MRKLGKFSIGVAAFLIMAGGLLALAGWVMGADRNMTFSRGGMTYHIGGPFGMWAEGYNDYESAGSGDTRHTDGQRDMEAFQDINIDVGLGDVRFETADDFGVDLVWYGDRYPMHYEMDGGELRVWSETANHHTGDDVYGGTVTIYMPSGAQFQSVAVYTDWGELEMKGLTVEDLTIQSDLGAVEISDVTAGSVSAALDLGEFKTRNLTVTGMTTVSSSMGSVDMRGTFREMEVSSDMGSVDISTSLPKADYSYSLAVDMGSITLDGEDMGRDNADGGSGAYLLDVSSSMGSIDISFGG